MNFFAPILTLIACSPEFLLQPVAPPEKDETDSELETEVIDSEPTDSPVDSYVDTEYVDTEIIDTEDTGPVPPTGLVGGLSQISYLYVPCPSCFVGQTSDEIAHATTIIHQPGTESWVGWIPENGCITSDLYPDPPVNAYDFGQNIGLELDGYANTTLNKTFSNGYINYKRDPLSSTLLYNNSDYDLKFPETNFWTDFEIQGAVHTPTLFTHFQPSQMLATDLYNAYSSVLRRNLVNAISWQPNTGDHFVVLVEIYSWEGSQYLGGILCAEPDDGYLEIPAGSFAQYPINSLAAVYAYKMERTESIIPFNGSTLEGVGQFGIVGTAIVK